MPTLRAPARAFVVVIVRTLLLVERFGWAGADDPPSAEASRGGLQEAHRGGRPAGRHADERFPRVPVPGRDFTDQPIGSDLLTSCSHLSYAPVTESNRKDC